MAMVRMWMIVDKAAAPIESAGFEMLVAYVDSFGALVCTQC